MKPLTIYPIILVTSLGISAARSQSAQNFPYGITFGNPAKSFIDTWDAGNGHSVSQLYSLNGGLILYSDIKETTPGASDGGIMLTGDPVSIVPASGPYYDSGTFDVWKASEYGIISSQPVFRVDTVTNTAVFNSLAVSIMNGNLSVDGNPVLTNATAISSGFLKTTDGVIAVGSTIASTSSTTGALTIAGGIGIAKDSWINGVRIGTGERGGSLQSHSTALGAGTLQLNTSGKYNTAIGKNTLGANLTGSSNVAVGYESLKVNTSGYSNSAVGNQSLASNTTGYWNTAQGVQSLFTNTTGYCNAAAGGTALSKNTTGFYNSAFGTAASRENSTGVRNTAVGCASLMLSTTGSDNTSIGSYSLFGNTTGYSNVALGYEAGRFQANGTSELESAQNSIYIGSGSRGMNNSDSNSIVIGSNAISEGPNSVVIGNINTSSTHLLGEARLDSLKVTGRVVIEQPQGDISMGIYGN